MRRDTITVQGFPLECFLYEGYAHTWECPGWKKTENLIDRRGWNKKNLKNFKKLISGEVRGGGEGAASISDQRVVAWSLFLRKLHLWFINMIPGEKYLDHLLNFMSGIFLAIKP